MAGWPSSARRWLRIWPQLEAAGDQITGRGPSPASSQPSARRSVAPPEALEYGPDEGAAVAELGLVGAVERLGQVGHQVDLLRRHRQVDDGAVAGVAERVVGLAVVAAAAAAAAGGEQRRRPATTPSCRQSPVSIVRVIVNQPSSGLGTGSLPARRRPVPLGRAARPSVDERVERPVVVARRSPQIGVVGARRPADPLGEHDDDASAAGVGLSTCSSRCVPRGRPGRAQQQVVGAGHHRERSGRVGELRRPWSGVGLAVGGAVDEVVERVDVERR